MRKILTTLFFLYFLCPAFSQVKINEFQASNTRILEPESGNSADWIELYNTADSTVDIGGMFITDDLSEPSKWKLPVSTLIDSKGYLIVWADKLADGLHTNFGLSSDGESIGLFSEFLELEDSISYASIEPNVSYARLTDGNSQWTFQQSSFSSTNTNQIIEGFELSLSPMVNLEAGFFEGAQTITISGIDSTYYSLDGSQPSSLSNKYFEPLEITNTTVLRVVSYESGKLPSEVITKTYFIDEDISFPVLSISTTPANLWDDNIGIFAIGTNGETKNGTTANYWNDWEREVNVEYFEDEKGVLNQRAGLEVIGERRNSPQKSLRINARGKYGKSTFDHKFFDDKNVNEFKALLLRNGGFPDYQKVLFKDGFCQELAVSELDVDHQSFTPSVLFVNGEYFGIHNIREKANEDYLESNFGVNSNNVDILDDRRTVIEGSADHFNDIYSAILNAETIDSAMYELIDQAIDINNFVDYHLAQIYYANTDWPGRNQRKWREQTPEGKWRWIFTDLDVSMGTWDSYNHNTLVYAVDTLSEEWNNPKDITFFIQKMLSNDQIANLFIQRSDIVLNTLFSSENVNMMLDSMKNHYSPEIMRHAEKWGNCDLNDPYSADGCSFKTKTEWEVNVNSVRDFATFRPGILKEYIRDYFGLQESFDLDVRANEPLYGSVSVNGVLLDGDLLNMYGGVPVSLKATPKPGYRFMGWIGIPSSNSSLLEITLDSNYTIVAYFEETGEEVLPNEITTNLTLTKDDSPYLVNNDLIVRPNVTLTIEEGVEFKMSNNANIIVQGNVNFNGSKNSLIKLVSNINSGFDNWGALVFENATDSSNLSYVIVEGASHGHDISRDRGAISSWNSVVNMNHVNITEVIEQPIFAQESNIYLTNSVIYSQVTGDLINVKRGYAYIDSCTFIGNNMVDTDAIDYDGISDGVIKNSVIHSFFGDNSDGIDLGEQSLNILVENVIIYDCTDKGVSIGQGSTAQLKNNIIYACIMGVGIKDEGSFATIDKNTFYGNEIGIAAFEKNVGRGGGKAEISNSIVSNSLLPIFFDEFSNIKADYSLFQGEIITGTGNISETPEFVNPNLANFELKSISLAIDAGNPLSVLDGDNSRTDMGAIFNYEGATEIDNIYINEFVASNSDGIKDEMGDHEDWIEIYNDNDYAVDLAGLYLTDSLPNLLKWKIPSSSPKKTRVSAKGYTIFWADLDTLDNANHMNFKLSALGEQIGLTKLEDGIIVNIDSISYDAIAPNTAYARYADGTLNWAITTELTPGFSNNGSHPIFKTSPNTVVNTGFHYKYDIVVFDKEGDQLSVTVSDLPNWLTFIDNGDGTASLFGTPEESDINTYVITLTLSDGIFSNTVTQYFEISVTDILTPLKEENTATEISAFPNPFFDQLKVVFKENELKGQAEVKIINSLGVILETRSKIDLSQIEGISFDTSGWREGIYFAIISVENKETYKLKVTKF